MLTYLRRKHKSISDLLIWIVLLIAIAIVVITRIQMFPSNSFWIADVGRDVLAGYLIAFRDQETIKGHYNSGINSVYPSIYYYFMAGLSLLARGETVWVFNYLILFQGFGAVLFFLIAKNFFMEKTALILSIIYLYSTTVATFSFIPLSAYNSVPIYFASMLLLINYKKTKKKLYLLTSSILFAFACSFYFGYILTIPLNIILFIQNKKEKTINKLYFSLIYLLILINLILLLFYPTLNLESPKQPIVTAGLKVLSTILDRLDFSSIKSLFLSTFLETFPKNTLFLRLLFCATLVVGLLKKKTRFLFFSFSLFTIVSFLFYLVHDNPLSHYLFYLKIYFIFFTGYILNESLKQNVFLFIALSILVFIGSGGDSFKKGPHGYSDSYLHYENVSKIVENIYGKDYVIVNHANCEDENNLEKFLQQKISTWDSRSYWIFNKDHKSFSLEYDSQIESITNKRVWICYMSPADKQNQDLNDKNFVNFDLDDKRYFTHVK